MAELLAVLLGTVGGILLAAVLLPLAWNGCMRWHHGPSAMPSVLRRLDRDNRMVDRVCEHLHIDPRSVCSVRVTCEHWIITTTDEQVITMPNPERMRERQRRRTRTQLTRKG